jgi:2-keto-4-pentenoate hydratase/2-oxohepta-3-ene-1,7-dioic acid hydratase in catechol pathway
MGPWITPRAEITNPNNLAVIGHLDDEVFTYDNTANYRFTVEECIAEASRYFTLEPGDLISFGTTGKGSGRFPRGHKSLLLGEEHGNIRISIEPLGQLSNPIKHQTGGA